LARVVTMIVSNRQLCWGISSLGRAITQHCPACMSAGSLMICEAFTHGKRNKPQSRNIRREIYLERKEMRHKLAGLTAAAVVIVAIAWRLRGSGRTSSGVRASDQRSRASHTSIEVALRCGKKISQNETLSQKTREYSLASGTLASA
jgi:hypothetical protein